MNDKELLNHLPLMPHKEGGKKFTREELESLVEYFRNELSKKETCVLCGSITPYNKNDDINMREHYVEGAGQLCDKCFIDIYGEK